MQNRIKRGFIILLSMIFQFSFALIFTSSPHLLIDNLLNQYTEEINRSNLGNSYIHAEVTLKDNQISNESTNFVRENISRYKETVTYYTLLSKDFNNPKFTTINYSSTPTILYNPYRYDLNNKYFESFRIRQVFNNVDSRIIGEGLDFNIQISNKEADQIIANNKISSGYEYFIDNKVEVFLNYNDVEYKGRITNLFYMEDEEPISTELYDYNGDYSIIVPGARLRNDVEFKMNHDFINNSMRIKKEMEKLNSSFEEENIRFVDWTKDEIKLSALYQTINEKTVANLNILLPALFGVVFLATTLFFLIRSIKPLKEYVDMKLPNDALFSVVLFSVVLYSLKRIFPTGFFYMLSNLFSGLLTVFLFLFSVICLIKRKRSVIVNEQ